MALFNFGEPTRMHSGSLSAFRIDCNALTDVDLAALAQLWVRFCAAWPEIPSFRNVIGIERGGVRFADAIRKASPAWAWQERPVLVVDDVLTTGASMREALLKHGDDARGLVIFDRSVEFQADMGDRVWALFEVNPAAVRESNLSAE